MNRYAYAFNEASLKPITRKKSVVAQDFKSCIHELLLQHDNNELLTCLLPSELHLLLRVTNKLFVELQKVSSEVPNKRIVRLGLAQPKLHSGEFNGNIC